MTDWQDIITYSFWFRIFFSVICGSIVGLERQWRDKPMGIRTSVLICLATMTFVYLGETLPGEKDVARVLGQVVTGIGFLGAGGIILNREGFVVGLTSAAVVWMLAAIGAAIGLGHYSWALVLSVVEVVVLTGTEQLESVVRKIKK
ncbi:MAG: hypothetical protein COV74_10905 [Candidatus Omnitrophica bacterium CG11_big_fil_rev_8_21_14_0_20_45_26]|uniref:MgtC/SapB/SrpB/YhiD N-terminal domain-containing protein n=1 Tax=Candidatus Abzuiibacterium crystallinum TaxID=1974748 RepID=A0A2H0LKZ6_9BACT|nr:MAG: hypothetical protein COV74_10905 [Candidatus Omnitrophica bacterium CG11_big_fil_rev_8_21_14_0_20_45_26]PIW63825.1 MAG: hypothetical protein COW12_07905 [Candidatus Omnitrophica bacterium CG12_big_fil_rev_8_21_14_0_65_45_16]